LPLDAKRWIRIAFALWALAIGWSRLALGAHYVTDVIGGYLLGAAMASLALIAYRALGNPDDAKAPR
jgi:membrane-associated phospholipid phosphatase